LIGDVSIRFSSFANRWSPPAYSAAWSSIRSSAS
jgi:hypothetical protein